MIELLMVILLVALLGSVALPQFLDFRTEGRVAALQHNLQTLRSAIKNQRQQAILRCGLDGRTETTAAGISFKGFLPYMLISNDVTLTMAGQVCTANQITNPEERKFVSVDPSQLQKSYGGATGANLSNPFINLTTYNLYAGGIGAFTAAQIAAAGGPCGMATSVSNTYSWIVNTDTDEIFPGTNTAGINECNF